MTHCPTPGSDTKRSFVLCAVDWSGPTTSTSVCMCAGPDDYMASQLCGHPAYVSGAMSKIWCPTTCQTDLWFFRGDDAFRPFSPFPALRPRPLNRWHPWRIANRSLHRARVLYGLHLSRLTELHHTSMFCVGSMDITSELLFFLGATCSSIIMDRKIH